MRESWTTTTLASVTAFASGYGFSDRFQGQKEGALPFYKVSDMSNPGNDRFLDRANNYVSRELATSQGWRTIPPRAVVFAKVGAALLLNRRRVTTSDCLLDNNLLATIPLDSVTLEWLYWWLQAVDFGMFVQPGAVPSVNQRQVGSLPLALPPLPEQRKIAEVLDTLDEAIRKTEQIIAKLKQVKQGLLHDLLTRGIDHNGELRDPDRHSEQFKDSELGRIPKEWEVFPLPQLFRTISPGPRQDTAGCSGGGDVPVLDQSEEGFMGYFPGPAGVAASPMEPVVTFANHTCATRWITFPCSAIQNVFFMRASSIATEKFLFYVIRGRIPQLAYQGHWPLLRERQIATPPKPEQEAICRALEKVDTQRFDELNTVSKLRLLKQGLMEDLLTGKVRVTPLLDAEST